MRLIDADKVPPLSDMSGCAYEGSEYQAYKSGAEYGRGLVDDTPTIAPESLRPTAHWIIKDSFYKDSIVLCLSCAALRAKEISFCMVEHQKLRTTNIALPAAKGW